MRRGALVLPQSTEYPSMRSKGRDASPTRPGNVVWVTVNIGEKMGPSRGTWTMKRS